MTAWIVGTMIPKGDMAGSDAMTRYMSSSCLFACFPINLRKAIVAKNLSAVNDAQYTYDSVSNDGVCDKLWLFSPYEMNSGYRTVYSGNSITSDSFWADNKSNRSSEQYFWLRSPREPGAMVCCVHYNGAISGYGVTTDLAVAPGFCLPAAARVLPPKN